VNALAGLAVWGALIVLPLPAAEWNWPVMSGEFGGEFAPLALPGAPSLRWKMAVHSDDSGLRRTEIAMEGPGTAARVALQLAPDGRIQWRLESARLELDTWFALLAPKLGWETAGAVAQGTVVLEGDGTWQEGRAGGRARIRLEDGRFDDPARKLAIEGIAFDLTLEDLAGRRSAPAQTLTWKSGRLDTIGFGAGRMQFSIAGEQVQVDQSVVGIWGGEIRLAAFAFATGRMEMSVLARVVGIEIAQLLPLLPPVVSAARGRLDGSLSLRRDSTGIQIGAGRLAMSAGEPAELNLVPTPGLLSSSLPASVLKYYPGLAKIESGETPLRASRLEVEFTPGGDAEGRTASVRLDGGPVDPQLRAPVELVVNVRGPLESLVRLGTSSRLRFGSP
jgi:hypothetical protein